VKSPEKDAPAGPIAALASSRTVHMLSCVAIAATGTLLTSPAPTVRSGLSHGYRGAAPGGGCRSGQRGANPIRGRLVPSCRIEVVSLGLGALRGFWSHGVTWGGGRRWYLPRRLLGQLGNVLPREDRERHEGRLGLRNALDGGPGRFASHLASRAWATPGIASGPGC
jgi:hypothetical protein